MQVMSTYNQEQHPTKDLMPPSPRIMRLLSKTFNLWQDTWYFNRKQPEMNNIYEELKKIKSDCEARKILNEILEFSKIKEEQLASFDDF